jgi:hypothetical protein
LLSYNKNHDVMPGYKKGGAIELLRIGEKKERWLIA